MIENIEEMQDVMIKYCAKIYNQIADHYQSIKKMYPSTYGKEEKEILELYKRAMQGEDTWKDYKNACDNLLKKVKEQNDT